MTYSTTVTQKGQMMLSKEARTRLGIQPGQRVSVTIRGNTAIVEKDTYWQDLQHLRAGIQAKIKPADKALSLDEIKNRSDKARIKDWQSK